MTLSWKVYGDVMEWISIKDKTPELYKEYIICSNEGYVKTAVYIGDGKWSTYTPVAYWMPMPAPSVKASENTTLEEPVKKRRGRPKKI